MITLLNLNAEVTDAPEVDFQLALEFIRARDYGHALFHLGKALAADPLCDLYQAALKRILKSYPNCLEAHELAMDYFGMRYARALLLAEQQRVSEAIEITLGVAAQAGDYRYLKKCSEWLEQGAPFDCPQALLEVCSRLLSRCRDPQTEEASIEQLPHWLAFLDSLYEREPFKDEVLLFTYLALYRRSSDIERSFALSWNFVEACPGYYSYCTLAAHYKSIEDFDNAIKYFELAVATPESDPTTLLDLGDVLLTSMRYRSASRVYEKALALDEQNDWARASLLYCKLMNSGDTYYSCELKDLAQEGNRRAVNLARNIFPFVDFIPTPLEQVIDVARDAFDVSPGTFDVQQFFPEAPSAIECLRRHLLRIQPGVEPRIYIQAEGSSTEEVERFTKPFGAASGKKYPDPWSLSIDQDGLLTLEASYAKPGSSVMDALCTLASEPYDFDYWWKRAKELGSTIATDEDLEEMIAAFCHIEPGPSFLEDWNWVARWQIACAFMIAQADVPIEKSLEVLIDICHGSPDWANGACLLALAGMVTSYAEPEDQWPDMVADLIYRIGNSYLDHTSLGRYMALVAYVTLPRARTDEDLVSQRFEAIEDLG